MLSTLSKERGFLGATGCTLYEGSAVMTSCGFCGSIDIIFCWDLERFLTGVDFDDMKVNNLLMLLNFLAGLMYLGYIVG